MRGGIRTHVNSILGCLDPRRWRVIVASCQGPGEVLKGEVPRALGGWVPLAKGWTVSPVALARAALRLRRAAGEISLCHAHGLRAAVLVQLSGVGIPTLISLHNLLQGVLSVRTARFLADRPATRVHAVSHAVASSLQPGSVEIIPNGWRQVPGVGQRAGGPCRLLCVSRLAQEKGVHLLLEALNRIDGQRDGWILELVGDGPMRPTLEKYAEEAGLSPRIEFAGWVENVTPHYTSADILVVPSLREGAGLVVAEGMSAGLPVLATRAGGIPEMIAHRRTGWLVEPGDAGELASALQALMSNPDQRRQLGDAARKEAAGKPRWEDAMEDIQCIYEDLIGA